MTRVNFFDLNFERLQAFVVAAGYQPFRAKQLMKWVYHQGITEFSEMTDLSKAMRTWLAEEVSFDVPEVVQQANSTDGTVKPGSDRSGWRDGAHAATSARITAGSRDNNVSTNHSRITGQYGQRGSWRLAAR